MNSDLNIGDRSESNAPRAIDLQAGRRAFIRTLGLGAVGAAVFGAAEGVVTAADAQTVTDADILNFALNLEYLESTFYLFATTGAGLPAAFTGSNPGQVTGGSKVAFSSTLVNDYAQEIALEEKKHVKFLRDALGSAAVSLPNLNIGTAFTNLAVAANLIPAGSTFDAYASDTNFLLASYIFEDVGVTAYHGAATLIQNKSYLDAAAGILAVEAYHSGIIRTSLYALNDITVRKQTNKISNLRSTLSSGQAGVDDVGLVNTNSTPQLTPVDAPNSNNGNHAIAYDRTTRQVLNIVYGAANASSGLFFPNGLNGTIK